MRIRYEDLKTFWMRAADGSDHPVRDVFVSEEDLAARYVVVDIGGWVAQREAVVGIERFAEPDVGAGRWPSDLAQDELEQKPGPAEVTPGGAVEERRSPKRVPVLGPVGGRILPWMVMGPRPEEDSPMREKVAPGQAGGLRSAGDLLTNTHVAAEDGQAGVLMGLIFDTDGGWRVSHLIIETGGDGPAEHQRVVPVSLLGRIDWDKRQASLTGSVRQVHDSPDLHEMDGLEGKWYNKVMAYYGLQS